MSVWDRSFVSREERTGTNSLPVEMALTAFPRYDSDWLMAMASFSRGPVDCDLLRRSLPARSRICSVERVYTYFRNVWRLSCNTVCARDEFELANVGATALFWRARWRMLIVCCSDVS